VKKAVIAILALLYIITTSGVVVNVHYCMGTVASVTYGHEAPESCGKCGMEEKDGCCHSELKVVKLDDVHQQAIKASQIAQVAELPVVYFETTVAVYNSHKGFVNSYHSPPDNRVNAIYLSTGIFRI
jgi:hypothetical protein